MVFMWCVLPPRNTACNPFGVDVEATQARQGCPSTPLPLLVEAAQNVRGVASHAKGPGARASGVPPPPRSASPPLCGVSGHPDRLWSLSPSACSRWVGFYVEGGTRHPPPGPTTPTGKPSRGICVRERAPRDVGGSLGVREPAQATPRTPQGDVWLASCTPPIMPTLMGPLCVRHPGARQTRPTGL